jgi:UDP-N-acetylmuramoyl-tripeptide--D-alanyl-D-alanine ligase
MRLTGLEIQQVTKGHWLNTIPESIDGVQTDTRQFPDKHAFLALRGPNFDGHQFASAIASQAQALIGDVQGTRLWKDIDIPQLEVSDTLQALGDIAHAWRNKLANTSVIAITGSYGKTTIRSMLEHVFSSLGYNTAATQANLNNRIGVPMTLLQISEYTDIALIECGISEIGEMQKLASIVNPDIAIITGITSAHAEGLGGTEGVAKEKSILLNHLKNHGWSAWGRGVSEQIAAYTSQSPIDLNVSWQLQGNTLTLNHHGETAHITLALPAAHWAENMAFVSTIVLHYCQQHQQPVSVFEIAKALEEWKPVSGRLQAVSGIYDSTILDDSYNANPISMQAALNTLASLPQRRVAILGDMAELGNHSGMLHAQLDVSGVDRLMLVGKDMELLHKQYPDSLWFTDTDSLLTWLEKNKNTFSATDTILIKASRSMQLDRAVAVLSKQGDHHAV